MLSEVSGVHLECWDIYHADKVGQSQVNKELKLYAGQKA
jgi:hypothetical protein